MSSSLDCLDLCRLCLIKDRVSVPIFEDEGDVRQIFLKITACLPVKVSRDDKLPKKICDDCVYKVELFYQFWNTTANAEKQLLQWLGEVDLEDKQTYVTEVLDTNVMKQEQNSDNRLEGNVIQVSGHQNNMDIGMIEDMTIMTIPAGSEQQFTTVPMDTSGTVQTVQAVPGPSTHDQMGQSQTHLVTEEVEESEEEENSDDGCDNEEGLPVKEETEEVQTETFVNVPISCDEAGPSGLQQQKVTEMSEMSMTQTATDGDPKTGICILDNKEPRVILPRWTDLEIEMMKAQLKEYHWLKEENNNNHHHHDHKTTIIKRIRRKRRKIAYIKNPYCKFCHKYFRSYAVLATHKRTCANKNFYEFRKEKPQKGDGEKENEKFEVRPFITCKNCKEYFSTTQDIFKHRQYLKCINTESDEETDISDNTDDEYDYDILYTCKVCQGKFISSELLMNHRIKENHFNSNKLGVKTRKKNGFKVAKNEIEDFTFRSNNDNEYSCTTCNNNVIYYDPDDLLKHHRSVHPSIIIYCRYCSQKLNNMAEFSDHHNMYHELQDYCRICNDKNNDYLIDENKAPPKPLCLNCSKKLNLLYDDCLTFHKENLYCNKCERVMPTLAHVKYHKCYKVNYRFASIAMLVCPLCLKMFNNLRSLYRHIIKHSDIMNYRCNDCGKLHNTWKALKEHSTKCHNVIARLPKVNIKELRKTADDVITRFVKNGVTLLVQT